MSDLAATTHLPRPVASESRLGASRPAAGSLYVANSAGNHGIEEFAPSAHGDVTPTATIAGSKTLLKHPTDVAVTAVGGLVVTDASGELVITSLGSRVSGSSISVFAPNATGNRAPRRVVIGTKTHLSGPLRPALDAAGDLWVPNSMTDTLTRYAAGASGNVAPTRQIKGPHPKLATPVAVAVYVPPVKKG